MNLYKKGNFSETPDINQLKLINPQSMDELPDSTVLPDGEYNGIRYGYTLELVDGKKYKLKEGVRNTRPVAIKNGYKKLTLKSGKIVTFSGFAEAGGILSGRSYGPKDPSLKVNPTKIKLDEEGFRIPKDMNGKINLEDRAFALNDNSGKFTGSVPPPTIGISKDNSIIRKGNSSNSPSGSSSSDQPNAMTDVSLEWNRDRTFHLAVEPWITTPLISDTEDGIYIGNVKGNNFDTQKKVITMAVKVDIDYPASVVCLVKNQKAYLFKTEQLTATTGSKLFSELRSFADPEEDEKKKKKKKSEETEDEGKGNESKPENNPNETQTPDQNQEQQTQEPQQQKQPVTVNRSKKGEEKQRQKELEESGENQEASEQDNPQGPQIQPAVQPEFKTSPVKVADTRGNEDIQYRFEYQVSEPKFEIESIIGTVVMSTSFAHLFHLCITDYPAHMALDEYYKKMPELVDNLAENFLATTQAANFQVCIVPKTLDPVDYFMQLQEFVSKYQQEKLNDAPKFSSLIDDILQLIGRTLYKLKRLKSGRKMFSFSDGIRTKEFGSTGMLMSKEVLKETKNTISDAITAYIKKYRKPPVKEIKTTDGHKIRQYVNNNVIDEDSAIELLNSVLNGITDGIRATTEFK